MTQLCVQKSTRESAAAALLICIAPDAHWITTTTTTTKACLTWWFLFLAKNIQLKTETSEAFYCVCLLGALGGPTSAQIVSLVSAVQCGAISFKCCCCCCRNSRLLWRHASTPNIWLLECVCIIISAKNAYGTEKGLLKTAGIHLSAFECTQMSSAKGGEEGGGGEEEGGGDFSNVCTAFASFL